jgi:hypothetical protein
MRVTRRNMWAGPKIMKDDQNTKSINQNNKKIKKKSMFSTSKEKRSRKFLWGHPDGICDLDSKS